MTKATAVVALALVIVMVGLLAAASIMAPVSRSGAPRLVAPSGYVGGPSSPHPALAAPVVPTAPAPATTFPRTVLVETFTAVWCIHCPAESSALFNIDRNYSHNTVAIAELHVCAFPPGQGPCLETYVPPDNTATTRGTFYNVCGYPDVFFDGGHDSCGASNSMTQEMNDYLDKIGNASAIPGNVMISQNAVVGAGHSVSDHANITSGVTGTYNAITYLLEFINKQNISNGYGPHDLAYVVRSTLFNHPVNLTAGATTAISATGALNTTWNPLNLSVITFVQLNSTKAIQNTNMAPVMNVATAVSPSPATVEAGASSVITVHVTNASTGAAMAGASVTVTSNSAGALTPAAGVTAANGTFTSTYRAPSVSATTTVTITANVTQGGITIGSGSTTVTVTPLFPPGKPTGLNVLPGNGRITLSWSAPSSGGSGVTYHIYRSATQTGTYTAVNVSTATSVTDASLVPGHSYWYMVNAQGPGGFSGNASPIAAVSMQATTVGLPTSVGWWLSVGSLTLQSATDAAISLHVPIGSYNYTFGSASFAFLAPQSTGTVTVADDTPVQFVVAFAPNYATLHGTIAPADAAVTINGTAIQVSGGSFTETLTAGTYSLVVTSPGFIDYNKTVQLTPGNTTTVNVELQNAPSPPATDQTFGGMSLQQVGVLGAVIVVIVAGLGAALLVRRRKKGPQAPAVEPESPS